jgi:uncharacterized protein (TIGR02145 family)
MKSLFLLVTAVILGCSSESREGERVRTMTDPRDDQLYPTIGSAGHLWLARNLDFTTPGSWCRNDQHEECAEYGRLYSWEEARTACPAGWHLPTEAEWVAILDGTGDAKQAYTAATTGSFMITMAGSRAPDGRYSDSDGMYWTSTSCGADSATVIVFDQDSGSVGPTCHQVEGWGLSVRCTRSLEP